MDQVEGWKHLRNGRFCEQFAYRCGKSVPCMAKLHESQRQVKCGSPRAINGRGTRWLERCIRVNRRATVDQLIAQINKGATKVHFSDSSVNVSAYGAVQQTAGNCTYADGCSSAKKAGICLNLLQLEVYWMSGSFFRWITFYTQTNVAVYSLQCQKIDMLQQFLDGSKLVEAALWSCICQSSTWKARGSNNYAYVLADHINSYMRVDFLSTMTFPSRTIQCVIQLAVYMLRSKSTRVSLPYSPWSHKLNRESVGQPLSGVSWHGPSTLQPKTAGHWYGDGMDSTSLLIPSRTYIWLSSVPSCRRPRYYKWLFWLLTGAVTLIWVDYVYNYWIK